MRWKATHSLFLSSNYLPEVEEADHGTWRRLALVRFPYRYRKPGESCDHPDERAAAATLRDRVTASNAPAHPAILAWLVDGAYRWYQHGRIMPPLPTRVVDDTAEHG